MSKPSQQLYTAGQVRELDRAAIEDSGIDAYELMQRAGLAAYRLLRYRFPRARRITVLCGSGNNGGDGYVLASLARRAGLEVSLVAVSEAKSTTAKRARDEFEAGGGVAAPTQGAPPDADVVVDGLLGTGLDRPPAGAYAAAVEWANQCGRPVLALDIPSGLHADTGAAFAPCVQAAGTATFIGRKLGCFTADGPQAAGPVYFDDLNVPAAVYAGVEPAARLIEPRGFAERLARPAGMHKGDAGRVLLVGGNHDMPGAPCMSAQAAHRGGAGLVFMGTRARPVDLIANTLESMASELRRPDDVSAMAERADVIAVGPGLGRDDWARGVWERVRTAAAPLVVDADALTLLADDPARRDDWILTPHPGEAARLLETTVKAVQADRPGAARALRRRYGGVVVLKGAGTLVLGESLWLCDRGNPGMASGGMGDALTGVIAALRGQGLAAEDAAAYGVWCHGRAGDRARGAGNPGLTAGDLIDALPDVIGGAD